jgi:hypothetical protein
MDRNNNPVQPTTRRRILWRGALAATLLVMLWLLFVNIFGMPRLRDPQNGFPDPLQIVRDWLFPPPPLVLIDVDVSGSIEILDEVVVEVPDPDVLDNQDRQR